MNNKAIYFIGGFIWALVSSRKAYAPNTKPVGLLGDIDRNPKNTVTPSPTSQEDCADGFTYQPQKIIPIQCMTAPCTPMKSPAMCVKNRKSMLDAKIKQVGNWTPNDTSCTPCTTMAYEGGRGTMRIHKSWCDINCTEEVKRANQLRNPFGNLINFRK